MEWMVSVQNVLVCDSTVCILLSTRSQHLFLLTMTTIFPHSNRYIIFIQYLICMVIYVKI